MHRRLHSLKPAAACLFALLLVFVFAAPPARSAGEIQYVFRDAWGSFGSGDGEFYHPTGVEATANFVFVADTENDRVQSYSLGGIGKTGADPALLAPRGVTVSGSDVFIVDTYNNRVLKYNTNLTVQGSFSIPSDLILRRPSDAAVDDDLLYVTDTNNNRVVVLDNITGALIDSWAGEPGSSLSGPHGIAVDPVSGSIFVADTFNNRIVKRALDGAVNSWGEYGSGEGQFDQPRGVAVAGGYVYVADTGNDRVQVFNAADGAYVTQFGGSGSAEGRLKYPMGVSALSVGDRTLVYVADTGNHRVQVFEPAMAPTSIALSPASVAENAPAGVTVGTFLTFDPNPGEDQADFTYALVEITGQDCSGNAAFTINGRTLVTNATFDYETQTSYPICVEVTDPAGLSFQQTLAVSVTNVKEAPVLDDITFDLTENPLMGDLIGALEARDADAAADLTWDIVGGSYSSAFSLVKTGPRTANLYVLIPSVFNYEAYADHQVTVEVRISDGGLTDTALVTVNLLDANDPPEIIPEAFSVSLPENHTGVLDLIKFNVTDEDVPAQTITFTTSHAAFAVAPVDPVEPDGMNYVLQAVAPVDYEQAASITLTITATDSGSPSADRAVTITVQVTNVNEPPVLTTTELSVEENSPNNTLVGFLTADDPEGAVILFFSTPDETGPFAVDGVGGVTVRDSNQLDYETLTSYTLPVAVTDPGGLTYEGNVVIYITNVNEAPTITGGVFSIDENAPAGAVVGTVTFSDPDGDALAFSGAQIGAGKVLTVDADGTIKVADSSYLDYETRTSFTTDIAVTDPGGLNASAVFTFNINDRNEQITIDDQEFYVQESAAVGARIGEISWSDPDDLDGVSLTTPAFTVTGGDCGSLFSIVRVDTHLYLDVAGALDADVVSSCTIDLQISDDSFVPPEPTTDSATLTIYINQNNNPPSITAATFSVAENSLADTVVGTVSAVDPDPGDSISFAITGGSGKDFFAIDSSSGTITVADQSALDYETVTGHAFTLEVTVTDDGEPQKSASQTFTINLIDVNEPPLITDQTVDLPENTYNGITVVDIDPVDPDQGAYFTYAITGGDPGCSFTSSADPNPNCVFTIDAAGKIKVQNSDALDYETVPGHTFTLTVQVTDNGQPGYPPTPLSDTATITINLIDQNDDPVITLNPADVTHQEHPPVVPAFISTALVTDQDGHTVTLEITGGNDSGAFALDPTTGEISIVDSAAFDYEKFQSVTLEITATDSGAPAASSTAYLTVKLMDINEAPQITTTTLSVPDGSPNGHPVGQVAVSDPDSGTSLQYAITGGTGAAAFAINSATGMVTVADASKVNYLQNPSLTLQVRVTDNGTPALSDEKTITVNVQPVADPAIVGFSGPASALTGINVELQLVVANLAGGVSGDYTARVTLPYGVRFISSPDGCAAADALHVDCTGTGLASKSQKTFRLVVQPSPILADATSLVFTAALTSNPDIGPGNNTATYTLKTISSIKLEFQDFEDHLLDGWYRLEAAGDTPLTFERDTAVTPAGARRFLGRFARNDRIAFRAKGLPQHGSVTISFDLYVIGSWDGIGPSGPDGWSFTAGGKNLVNATFSNHYGDSMFKQTFPSHISNPRDYPAMTGAVERFTLGYTFDGKPRDSVYHFDFVIEHSSPNLELIFESIGLQHLEDESWGIDNLSISLLGSSPLKVYLPAIRR